MSNTSLRRAVITALVILNGARALAAGLGLRFQLIRGILETLKAEQYLELKRSTGDTSGTAPVSYGKERRGKGRRSRKLLPTGS